MSGSPEGWVVSSIGSVADVTMGQSPPGKATNTSGKGLPLIGGAADYCGTSLSPTRHTSAPTKICASGDLILCIRATIGKLAEADASYCLGRGVAGLTPVAVERDYLRYFLRHVADDLDKAGTGTTFRQVDKQTLANWRIPLAPIAEQRRIVSKLDRLVARSQRASVELERIPVLVERYKRAVLGAAFNGLLSAEWREGKDQLRAVELSEGEGAGALGRASATPVGPYQLPEAWRWVPLPKLGELARGKSRHRPRNDPRLLGGPYPFVQTGDVRAANGFLTEHSGTYSEFGLAQSRLWPEGTVCITIAANIAESAILGIDACFPDSVVGFVADDALCSNRFVEYFIRTAKGDLEEFAPATAQKNINLNTLAEVLVPVPPRLEQDAIVAQLDHMHEAVSRALVDVEAAAERLEQVEKVLIAKAFRGDLVGQMPDDEPAAVLLERIRKERESAPKAARKTRKKVVRKKR